MLHRRAPSTLVPLPLLGAPAWQSRETGAAVMQQALPRIIDRLRAANLAVPNSL